MKLKNIKRKRLNNKGFTLIELLAVVVILAVVMGIAMTSVLSAMNNSRKGSLQDSANSVAQAFQTKYSEALVTNSTANVYGDVLNNSGYDFTTAGVYELSSGLNNELNLSTSTYHLGDAKTSPTNTAVTNSFVVFDGSSFTVCLVAVQSGSYYVSTATGTQKVTINSTDYTFAKSAGESGNVMWACSLDGEYSWK
jgi:type IV pilus assembly protein PilA